MGAFLDTVYAILFHPVSGLREAAAARRTGHALTAFLLALVLPMAAGYLTLKGDGSGRTAVLMAFLHVTGSLSVWVIGSAVLHLTAEFAGGRGTATGLFAAFGLAGLPKIFLAPLWAAVGLLPAGTRPLATVAAMSVIGLWTLALHVLAIRETYCFSTSRAVAVIASPALALAALAAGAAIVAGSFMVPFSGIFW